MLLSNLNYIIIKAFLFAVVVCDDIVDLSTIVSEIYCVMNIALFLTKFKHFGIWNANQTDNRKETICHPDRLSESF